MGTKNNPGNFDCHTKADGDEPIFTLRAKDLTAPLLVRLWVHIRKHEAAVKGETITAAYHAKLQEALVCADEMEIWRKAKNKCQSS